MASKMTTDHAFIRRWAEERGGRPAVVKNTGRSAGDAGILRIDFPGYSGEGSLESISWEEFFQKFDGSDLALLYEEDRRDGQASRFNKLVRREAPDSAMQPAATRRRSAAAGTRSSRGQSDALTFLEKEHRAVEPLMERFASARGAGQQWQLARRIGGELTLHAEMEERSFYPEMRRITELQSLVKDSLQEHQEVKKLVRQIERMQRDDERLEPAMAELDEQVRHHVQEEEEELFPRARELCDRRRLVELGKTLRSAKRSLKQELQEAQQPARDERRVREDVRAPEPVRRP